MVVGRTSVGVEGPLLFPQLVLLLLQLVLPRLVPRIPRTLDHRAQRRQLAFHVHARRVQHHTVVVHRLEGVAECGEVLRVPQPAAGLHARKIPLDILVD